MWTAELTDEIASDFSVFHRIGDPMQLDSARYYRLAEFLPSYDGAVRRRMEAILRDAHRSESAPAAPSVPVANPEVLATKSEAGARQYPGFEYRK